MDRLRVFDTVKGKSDLDKELYVHDYCLTNFTYEYAPDDYSYTILGPILRNTAVCEGIAKYVKLALDYLGVKSIVVSGKAKNPLDDSINETHAWNIVEIEYRTFHLDVTFDMTVKAKINRYDYFNLCDDDIEKDHTTIGKICKRAVVIEPSLIGN
jgi:transglutaminase/protease-like cytokinesis protein 3